MSRVEGKTEHGRLHAEATPVEQPDPKRRFQPLQAFGQRGLGQMLLLGGDAQVAVFQGGEEVVDLSGIHGRLPGGGWELNSFQLIIDS